MFKNMTRKSFAFGALTALVASSLLAAPAVADNTGPVTLLPDGGTATGATFNSVNTTGLTVTAAIDPATQAAAGAGALEGLVAASRYIVTNAGGARITLDMPDAVLGHGFLLYSSDGNTTSDGTVANETSVYATANVGAANDVGTLFVVYTAATKTIETNAKKIVIAGANDGGGAAKDTIASLKITSSATSTVTLTAQSIIDVEAGATTTTGKLGAFEISSDAETVKLYPISAVSATTSILTMDRGATGAATFRVTYGQSINPYAVDTNTYVNLFKDGTSVSLDVNNVPADANVAKVVAAAAAAGKITVSGWNDDGLAAVAFGAGIYTAQAYYSTDGTTFVTLGGPSSALDLNNGLVADIATTDAYLVETANIDHNNTTDATGVRTGTSTVSVVAKSITAGAADIEKAGIKYKATVTAVALEGSLAVTGSATALEEDDVAVVYGISDSTGKVSFSLTNDEAAEDDQVTVAIQSLKTDGTYTTADTVTITWADAALTTFTASPGNYISGDNPTLTFKTKDQFGQPMSSTANGTLSVTVQAKIGGIVTKTKLNETKTVSNGEVAFTFANFATAAIPAQVEAVLYEGRTQSSVGSSGTLLVNVYNTAATSKVTVLDSYTTDITYVDYVEGDETDAAVAAAIELTGIASATGATISGSVQTALGVGQPGAAVTVSADGVLFYDSALGMYAEDTITVFTNEYGTYSVKAMTHATSATGHVVTLTSGTATASTKLFAYFPQDLLTANNLNLSWDLPAVLVKNTTYAVTAKLTDKWGNPVQTVATTGSVDFQGTGSVQVNGVETVVAKNFDKNGEATVFVRSIKDVAGPGSITATIKAVAGQYKINPTVTPAGGALGVDIFGSLTAVALDVKSTAWDETKFSASLSTVVDILDSAPAASADQKVNAGSFKGYVALYAKGYAGKRMSAKVGNDWVVVPVLASNFERVVEYTGAGYTVAVRIYIDRVLIDTITVTTK